MDATDKNNLLLLSFQTLLKNSPDMIFVKDTDLVYVAASTSFATMVGKKSGKELIGKTDFDIFSTELAIKYTNDDKSLLNAGLNIINYIEPLPDQNGQKSYSSTSKYSILDAKGNIIGILGTARDVTAQIELETERENSRLSRQMFDEVFDADLTENRLLDVNTSKWLKHFNMKKENSYSELVTYMAEHFVHPDHKANFLLVYNRDRLIESFKNGRPDFSHLIYLRINTKTDQYLWVHWDTCVYYSKITGTLRVTIFMKNVDEEIRSKQQLQKEASTDMLTGLSNRAALLDRINACLSGQSRAQTNALMFIDLDCFKQANDRWGHQFGDQVLKETASRLRSVFEGQAVFGRIGGDEFLVFLEGPFTRQELEKKAGLVIKTLTSSHFIGDEEMCITCSVGIAICDSGHTTLDRLYEQSDKAMYRAKEKGRNRFFFYDDM